MAKNEQQDVSQPGRRRVGVILHPARPEAVDVAVQFVHEMAANGIECVGLGERIPDLTRRLGDLEIHQATRESLGQVELMVVFGGDGTILRAAESVVPLGCRCSVNLGHVGFLAELESHDVHNWSTRWPTATTSSRSGSPCRSKSPHLKVSGSSRPSPSTRCRSRRPPARRCSTSWSRSTACRCPDGAATACWFHPTGSTAYAFSLGGPIIWPDVQAFLVIPMAAHALFARPMVLAPDAVVDLTLSETRAHATLWCDGRRTTDIVPRTKMRIKRGSHNLRVARLQEQPFTSRLVKKFELPIDGFRGAGRK